MLALAPRITCPVLYIRGDKEPAHVYPAEEFAARAGGRCDVRIVKDCDHFYGGREDTIAEIVTGLAAKTCWRKPDLARRRRDAAYCRHNDGRNGRSKNRWEDVTWHCIAEPC